MPEEKITVENPERDLGLEYCEYCKQNYPVKARIISSLDAGVHLQISGFHIHMGMSDEPITLAPRLIRIDDIDDFREIGKLIRSEMTRVSNEVQARDLQRAAEKEQDEPEICPGCGEPMSKDEAP